MNQFSRRMFLNLAGGSVAGAFGAGWILPAFAAAQDADLIVTNANIYTIDSQVPKAEAFAVKGGRILAVGSSADISGLRGAKTQIIDAKKMTVVPGFIDCHNHADGNELLYEVLVGNPFEVEFVTIDSIIEKLRARAQKTPPDTWVTGSFFDDTKVKDKRQLTVHDLDKVSKDLPVAVYHRGAHSAYYNSKALQMAGITKDTKDLEGGTYGRFADGDLNGRVTDRAMEVFENVGKRVTFTPEESMKRDIEGLAHISKQFARFGLTGVHHQGGNLRALEAVRDSGDLLHRVSFETWGPILDALIENGMTTGFGDEWIKLGATAEHTADGSFSERTMAMSTPYPGSKSSYQGNLTEEPEELNAWVEKVHRAGFQVNCHANGDVAIERVLTAYERAQKLFPLPDPRFKITHCTLINDSILKRMKALNVVPAVFSTYSYYNSDKFVFYGEELMKRMMAYRSFVDAGIYAAIGSDFSPGPFATMMGLQGMVTRKGWDGKTWGANQKVTVSEALKIMTFNGAYNSHEENIKGSITPGKLADFVVLAEDPHSIDPEKIKDINIVRTVTGGRTVYQA